MLNVFNDGERKAARCEASFERARLGENATNLDQSPKSRHCERRSRKILHMH